MAVLLQDRRIVVTGGARGIGAATVRAFVGEGAQVAVLDVLDDLGRTTVDQANESGPGKAAYFHCDVSRRADVETAFAGATGFLGGLDVLTAIAGVERTAAAEDLSDSDARLIMDINVHGTIMTNQVAFGHLKDHGGAIINVGSDAGLGGYRGLAAYGASKGAVMAWTRNVALEWGAHGVTVNALVPAIWTPMYNEHRARMSTEALAAHDTAMADSIVIGGKLGDPERDLGPVMVFLASPGARFVTGQIIAANGGNGMVR